MNKWKTAMVYINQHFWVKIFFPGKNVKFSDLPGEQIPDFSRFSRCTTTLIQILIPNLRNTRNSFLLAEQRRACWLFNQEAPPHKKAHNQPNGFSFRRRKLKPLSPFEAIHFPHPTTAAQQVFLKKKKKSVGRTTCVQSVMSATVPPLSARMSSMWFFSDSVNPTKHIRAPKNGFNFSGAWNSKQNLHSAHSQWFTVTSPPRQVNDKFAYGVKGWGNFENRVLTTKSGFAAEKPRVPRLAQALVTHSSDITGTRKVIAYWYFSPLQECAMRWVTLEDMSFLILPPIFWTNFTSLICKTKNTINAYEQTSTGFWPTHERFIRSTAKIKLSNVIFIISFF